MRRYFILTFLCFLLTFVPKAFAADRFSVSYDVKYNVTESGITTVTEIVHLKNLTSDFYATEYNSKIADEKIQNVRGSDRLGPLKINATDGEINVLFNDRVVGINKIYTWTMTFETATIAKKTGGIWEIILPKPSDLENVTDYNITLAVPPSFGQAAYLKPQPKTPYFWTRDQVKTSGIFAAFGEAQTYNFRLTYHLKNSSPFTTVSSVALPPTTSYQEIYFDDIDPKPDNVTIDDDGNWIAAFKLKGNSTLESVVSGKAQVFFKPRYQSPDNNLSRYLVQRDFWETTDSGIASKAASLSTPREISDFVSSYLTYDIARIDKEFLRLGAKTALENPKSAICMEFTDLFVAIARAAKIPSRELEGFAWTNNEKRQPVSLRKDVLHAWPEYYDRISKSWRMIDPTWQNTTSGINYFDEFDFNHIVFAIHGTDSALPYPAGSYKTDMDSKDVLVNFSDTRPTPNKRLSVTSDIPESIISGFNYNYNITVKNAGNVAVLVNKITVESDTAQVETKEKANFLLPPFGSKKIAVSVLYPSLLTSQSSIIRVHVNEQNHEFKTQFIPVNQKLEIVIPAISAIVMVVAGILWVAAKKRRHLPLF